MNIAKTPDGQAMVVLTRAEYDSLIEDAGDNALADQAAQDSIHAPRMAGDLAAKVLAGAIHPLAAWRKSAGLTQADLARRAQTRAATIADIENGKIDPRYSTLKSIAAVMGLQVGDIMP